MNDNKFAVYVIGLFILAIFLFEGDPDIQDMLIQSLQCERVSK